MYVVRIHRTPTTFLKEGQESNDMTNW